MRAALSSAFQYALRGGLIPLNPARATTTPTPQKPHLVTPDASQLRMLINAAFGTTYEIPVLLTATTGTRRAETLGLRWAQVDLDRGRIRIVETLQRVDGDLRFTANVSTHADDETVDRALAGLEEAFGR